MLCTGASWPSFTRRIAIRLANGRQSKKPKNKHTKSIGNRFYHNLPIWNLVIITDIKFSASSSLQSFDTVGWATRRASVLQSTCSNYYFTPGKMQSIAISVSVCLSARLENHTFKLQIVCTHNYLWPWLGPPLMAMQYFMYFRFCGWRHFFTQWSKWARIEDDAYVSSLLQTGGTGGEVCSLGLHLVPK